MNDLSDLAGGGAEPDAASMDSAAEKQVELRRAALEYHEFPTPGKISIAPTKSLTNQRDLALAYSPGVAAACEEIAADPACAFRYTARGNMVGVITNGTAVLGLGAIGPLAAKPVMEGKAVLFKKFAGIDVFDIEVAERDPAKLIEVIAALEPTFGGINLEDIKAPECFEIERALRKRMKIPVFHDDQHGTAIIVAAAMTNALIVAGKKIQDVKLVVSGAGAAALACVDLLLDLGLPLTNVWLTDLAGVVYKGRTELMDADKERFAHETDARTLADVIGGADVFLGLSAGGVLKPEMVARMVDSPIIFALANPIPEILPELAKTVRPNALIATGRTDYPNQVNNVLCFPFIFRGALDVGATTITREMEIATVNAIAELARQEQSDIVATAYGIEELSFGPDYLIPKPFDPRLIVKIAPAVAKAAMESGVAMRPIDDMDAYRERLVQFVYQSGTMMKPIFTTARLVAPDRKRLIFSEGEEERVLRAVQVVVDEKIATPILIGRPRVIEQRIARYGLRLRIGEDITVVNTDQDERYRDYWQEYHALMMRRGVDQQMARLEMRRRTTLIGAMMIRKGEADGMVCGTVSDVHRHLAYIDAVLGHAEGADVYAAMNGLILPGRQVFLVDTHINEDPTPQQLCEITMMAAAAMRRVGIAPKAALLSHSNFGSSYSAVGGEDARDAEAVARGGARSRGRRRDARRLRARRAPASRHRHRHDAVRRGEPARAAEHRRGEHRVQPAEDRGRQERRDRADPARLRGGGEHPDAVGDGAPDRQPRRADRRRGEREALTRVVTASSRSDATPSACRARTAARSRTACAAAAGAPASRDRTARRRRDAAAPGPGRPATAATACATARAHAAGPRGTAPKRRVKRRDSRRRYVLGDPRDGRDVERPVGRAPRPVPVERGGEELGRLERVVDPFAGDRVDEPCRLADHEQPVSAGEVAMEVGPQRIGAQRSGADRAREHRRQHRMRRDQLLEALRLRHRAPADVRGVLRERAAADVRGRRRRREDPSVAGQVDTVEEQHDAIGQALRRRRSTRVPRVRPAASRRAGRTPAAVATRRRSRARPRPHRRPATCR